MGTVAADKLAGFIMTNAGASLATPVHPGLIERVAMEASDDRGAGGLWRSLFRRWLDSVGFEDGSKIIQRRRIRLIIEAIRLPARSAEEIALKMALWRSARGLGDAPGARRKLPVEALLRSALKDMDAGAAASLA